jgi:hypothetical protein
METRTFQANRAKFPDEMLRAYDGYWVAFSSDGTRIIASAETLDELERELLAQEADPEEVGLERIEFNQVSSIGGAELL